ncbi:MAG: hypothetical protein ACOC2H_04580 [Spirochaetota bacterium]
MKRYLLIITLILPFLLLAQNDGAQEDRTGTETNTENIENTRPVQSIDTPMFRIDHVSFNKKLDLRGRGELVQVEFQMYNNTDVNLRLYIFVFATIEELEYEYNSFGTEKLFVNDTEILYFRAQPPDEELYTYDTENGGTEIVKYPKDATKGVNPDTGEPYLLKDTLAFRAAFLTHYRKNYEYFNHITLLIFDADDQELVYRQIWKLEGERR